MGVFFIAFMQFFYDSNVTSVVEKYSIYLNLGYYGEGCGLKSQLPQDIFKENHFLQSAVSFFSFQTILCIITQYFELLSNQ